MYKSAVVIPAFNEAERVGLTLGSLEVQSGISQGEHAIVVVDNGSTDDTLEQIEAFGPTLGPFDLHVVSEEQKGTGAAADTGFRYAIDELGVDSIARLDADTVPMPMWLSACLRRYEQKPQTALMTGPDPAGFDGGPTTLEALALPRVKTAGKLLKVLQHRSLGMLLFAPGHNMSTTAVAYNTVGGFPRTAIEDVSEDVVYTRKIAQEFGLRAMAWERNMFVFTSQRRLRQMGHLSALGYSLTNDPARRAKLTKDNANFR